jgi:hypothetical protein
MRARRVPLVTLVTLVTLGARIASASEDAEPARPARSDASALVARIGAGFGRSRLFQGSPDRQQHDERVVVSVDIRKAISARLRAGADVSIEADPRFIEMDITRVAFGGSVELHSRVLFLGVGPNVSWFFDRYRWFGPGLHATIGVEPRPTKHAGFHLALRGAVDALLSFDPRDATLAPRTSVTALAGLSFY